jgi:hypothetical protein
MKRIKITEIEYDMEVDSYNLPTELWMEVPNDVEDDDRLEELAQEAVFEETGYFAEGFMLVF